MRTAATLLCFVPALLVAQTLDGGLLVPNWFGPAAQFRGVPHQGFEWVKPGLSFQGRTLRIQAWEPAVWLGRVRDGKDRAFADQAQTGLRRDGVLTEEGFQALRTKAQEMAQAK